MAHMGIIGVCVYIYRDIYIHMYINGRSGCDVGFLGAWALRFCALV